MVDYGEPRRAARRNAGRVDLQVQFAFDSADLLPAGRRQLDELAVALGDLRMTANSFQLIGHTDGVGSADYNTRLSAERASAVKRYLVDIHRMAPERLATAGRGARQLADATDPAAAVNRRVEVVRVRAGGTP